MPAAPIQAVDERVLPFAPEQIWPVLADVTASPRWWPASIRLTVLNVSPGLIGSELEVCPRGGRPFRCRVETIEPPRRMRMRYGDGFVTGAGEWRLDAVTGGTRVVYALDVQAHGWLVALLGKFLPLGKIHSKSMQEVLANLEAEVRRRCGGGARRLLMKKVLDEVEQAEGDDQPTGQPAALRAKRRDFFEQNEQGQRRDPPEIHHAADEQQHHQRPTTAQAIEPVQPANVRAASNAAPPVLRNEGRRRAAGFEAGSLERKGVGQ